MQKNTHLFSSQKVADIKKRIDTSTTTSIIGIPGVGISVFLKYLAAQPFGYSLYIDVFALPRFTSNELFRALLIQLGGNLDSLNESHLIHECKILLEKLSEKNEKVIVYFAGFDQLKKGFTQHFFQQLRSLRNVNQEKIVFLFGVCQRIDSLYVDNLMNTDLHMLSSIYYLTPYSPEDLTYLQTKYGPFTELSPDELSHVLSLSGGHFQLLQLLMQTERKHDPSQDPFIILALHNLYEHLTYKQKKMLQKIAAKGISTAHDDYLEKIGLIHGENGRYRLFSPLLTDYVLSLSSTSLPVKEARLYSLLRKHIGTIVTKDDIFTVVWKDDRETASDWALDALIYRLRRHQAFTSQGYSIESKKKQGYRLIKNR